VVQILEPEMSEDERSALRRSAETLKKAASRTVAELRSGSPNIS